MDLNLAKGYSEQIQKKTAELNALIASATLDKVYTELAIFEVTTLGHRYYPTVKAEVTIIPTDID